MWNLVTLSPPAARKTSKYVHLNGHVIKKIWYILKKKKKNLVYSIYKGDNKHQLSINKGFPCGSAVKNPPAKAGDMGDLGSGRSPG